MLIRSSPSGYTAETYNSTYRHEVLHVNDARHSSEGRGVILELRLGKATNVFVSLTMPVSFSGMNIFGISRPRRPISVVY